MNDFNKEKDALAIERNEYRAKIDKGLVSADEGKAKISEFNARELDINQREAEFSAPKADAKNDNVYRSIAEDIISGNYQMRALTANGAGVSQIVKDIYTAAQNLSLVYPLVAKAYGKMSSAVVPVLSPTMALPVGQSENASSAGVDSTAVLTGKSIALKPYLCGIQVSSLAQMSVEGLTEALPGIFAEAFVTSIDNQICQGGGDGNNALGVFVASSSGVPTTSDVTAASGSATTLTWAHLLQLLAASFGKYNVSQLSCVINPSIMAEILADSTDGTDPFKNEYLMKGTVRGVKIIESAHALSTKTTGSYVAVCGNFSRGYMWASAPNLTIDRILTAGTDGAYYQACLAQNGSPIIGSAFKRLKTLT